MPHRPASFWSSAVRSQFRVRTRIYIPVHLNGKGLFTFELDSGGHFILAPSTVLALGLQPQGEFSSTGAGNEVMRAGYVSVDSVRIGAVEMLEQTAKVLPWSAQSNDRGTQPPRAGILGLELFEKAADGSFTIAGVISGSPAAEAGLKKGDSIDAIGAQPSRLLSRADVLAMFQQQAGTPIEIRLRDSSSANTGRSLTLQLRDTL